MLWGMKRATRDRKFTLADAWTIFVCVSLSVIWILILILWSAKPF
jgi:hypothetical protein